VIRLTAPILALLLAGCTAGKAPVASQEAAQAGGEKWYVVSARQAPFYEFGPAQPSGPSFGLPQGEYLQLLKREIGFSRVRLENGQEGYVANDFIREAPRGPSLFSVTSGRPTRAEIEEFVPPTFTDAPPSGNQPAPLIHFR